MLERGRQGRRRDEDRHRRRHGDDRALTGDGRGTRDEEEADRQGRDERDPVQRRRRHIPIGYERAHGVDDAQRCGGHRDRTENQPVRRPPGGNTPMTAPTRIRAIAAIGRREMAYPLAYSL